MRSASLLSGAALFAAAVATTASADQHHPTPLGQRTAVALDSFQSHFRVGFAHQGRSQRRASGEAPPSDGALPPAHLDHVSPLAMVWDGEGPEAPDTPSPASAPSPPAAPLRCYEVNRPPAIDPDALQLEACNVTLVERSFTNSYGKPSVIEYDPAKLFAANPACADVRRWVHLTLRQDGTSQGRQFDRLGSVQIQAVEVWRTDNPEPTRSGIVWSTTKDVNAYFDLFSKPGTLLFDYPNIIDNVYTGPLNITLSLTAYVPRAKPASVKSLPPLAETSPKVLPLSKGDMRANSFFVLGGDNATAADDGVTHVAFPQNAESALVEIYASGTATDEFWYTNVPDMAYHQAGPAASSLGLVPRGAFREIQLSIDGRVAGIVQPYPVIFTGGIDPSNWRPSAAYGAFVQPTYNIDVTPFLGELTDGAAHAIKLSVISAESNHSIPASWFVSGNVQVALGKETGRTTGRVTHYQPPGSKFMTKYTITGNLSNAESVQVETAIEAQRDLVIEGEVTTAGGKTRHVTWRQNAKFSSQINIKGVALQNFTQTSHGESVSTHNGQPFLSTRFDFPLSSSLSMDVAASKRNATVSHQFHQFRLLTEPRLAANTAEEQNTDVQQDAEAQSTISPDGTMVLASVGESLTSYHYQDQGVGDGVQRSFMRTNAFRNATVTRDEVSGSLAKYAPPVVQGAAKSDAAGAEVVQRSGGATEAKAERPKLVKQRTPGHASGGDGVP